MAVVTGGSGGIGTAIIHTLYNACARAISLDVCPPQSKETLWIKCDVRDHGSVAAAVTEVTRRHQRIDLTIHAAGVSREGVVWKLSVEDWDLIQSVNLRGAFLLLHHTIPVMRQGAGGRIVLIGSINGSRGKFGASAYSASKAGLLGLAKSVARGRPLTPLEIFDITAARETRGDHSAEGIVSCQCGIAWDTGRRQRQAIGRSARAAGATEAGARSLGYADQRSR